MKKQALQIYQSLDKTNEKEFRIHAEQVILDEKGTK